MLAWEACISRGIPKLICPLPVHAIRPPLVDVDRKDKVVSEDRQPMQEGHLDDKGEQVINDGVQELVCHLPPGEVSDALQLPIDVQLQSAETSSQHPNSEPTGCLRWARVLR